MFMPLMVIPRSPQNCHFSLFFNLLHVTVGCDLWKNKSEACLSSSSPDLPPEDIISMKLISFRVSNENADWCWRKSKRLRNLNDASNFHPILPQSWDFQVVYIIMVGIFQKQKGKAQETEHTQSPLIKTPSHATLNGSKQVRQVENSGMINQTSS